MRSLFGALVLALLASSLSLARADEPTADPRKAEAELLAGFRKPPRDIKMLVPGYLWIDAEDFADYGGWLLDTQFVHLMGSPYLIAAGACRPVADATVDVTLPAAGKYRLWVRAKDWLPEFSPGQFTVLVGGTATKHVFGKAADDAWRWESGGEFDLPQGKTRLALHDLTGAYGRCDALLLTTDLDYQPPADVAAIAKQRARLTGLSLQPKSLGQFDVVVVGAGAAGSCAAIAAARLGAKTVLIQDRPVLGGNASIELGVPINGAASAHPNARESGIIEEAGRIKARWGYPKMSEPLARLAAGEKNLTVLLNQRVVAAEMADAKTIRGVRTLDTLTGAVGECGGREFIDCTGDGWLGYFAGAKFHYGREARDEYDESRAPEKADRIAMSGCIMGGLALSYRAENVGRPSPYVPPAWAAKLPPPEEIARHPHGFRGGDWWLERRGAIDTITQAEQSRDELIRITFGYWNYIKNGWEDRQQAENYALTYVPIVEAKRESRRLLGDYVLTQNDCQQGAVFPDRVSYGGWPLDVHHPEGIYSGRQGPFWSNDHVPIYTIPFRCLYSANIENLLMAGRDVSVSHIALGTVRVQGTLAALGQAAGTAAAMCAAQHVTPRTLAREQIAALQQTLLKYDQYIPGLRNEDPADLARIATVTASSVAPCDVFDRKNVDRDQPHPLNMPRAMMFHRGLTKKLDSVFLLLSSQLDKPAEVTLHVRQAAAAGDFSAERDIAQATATVPPGRTTFVEFPLGCELDQPYVWLWLPKTEGLSWHLMHAAPPESCRAYGGGAKGRGWTVVKGQYYAFFTRPSLAVPADYAAANVINGLTRIEGRQTNQWASDPQQSLPQSIELSFERPVRVDTAFLTFDTDMNAPYHTVAWPKQCVRDYDLSYFDGQQWQKLATVDNNFQRRREHHFPAVSASKFRLTVTATNGDRSARVFEIRLYGGKG